MNFFQLAVVSSSVLALFWVGFLFWGCFWVDGEDTVEDTGVFSGVFFASSFVGFFGNPNAKAY